MDQDRIVWPGGLTQKPTGLMIPTHLKVLTIMETPFVYARKLDPEAIEAYKREAKTPRDKSNGLPGVMDFIGGPSEGEGEDDWRVNSNSGGASGASAGSSGGGGSSAGRESESGGGGGKSEGKNGGGGASASTANESEDQDFPEGHCDPVTEIPCPLYDKSGRKNGKPY